MFEQIMTYLIPVFGTAIVWLLRKIFKVEADKAKIEEIIAIIIDIIYSIEKHSKTLTGDDKRGLVIKEAEARLTSSQKGIIGRSFGSIGNAVEFVFQTIVQPNILNKKIAAK